MPWQLFLIGCGWRSLARLPLHGFFREIRTANPLDHPPRSNDTPNIRFQPEAAGPAIAARPSACAR